MRLKKEDVVAAYNRLIANEAFQKAVGSDTAGLPHTADRLRLWGEELSRSLGISLRIPHLETSLNGETRLTI
jgi:hypothetical protein